MANETPCVEAGDSASVLDEVLACPECGYCLDDGGDPRVSAALEKYRQARFEQQALKLLEERGELIKRADVHAMVAGLAKLFRNVIARFRARYGDGADELCQGELRRLEGYMEPMRAHASGAPLGAERKADGPGE